MKRYAKSSDKGVREIIFRRGDIQNILSQTEICDIFFGEGGGRSHIQVMIYAKTSDKDEEIWKILSG